MTQLVVGAVGAYVGFLVGGPAGASIGWSIGVAISAPTQRSKGPRLGELTVMSAAYGDTIPWIAGNPRIAGQIWWSSIRREVGTTTDQGKGGGAETTTYTYEIDLLIGLCDREITYVSRIWSNGKLVWTSLVDADDESISNSNVVTDWARLTVYTGAADQLPDPTYEAAVGVGNAPAYRGRGSVFIEALQLGSGGQVPNLTFEVVVDGTVTHYDKGFLCQFDEFSSGASVVTELGPEPVLSGSAVLDTTIKKWGDSSVKITYPAPSSVDTTNTILNDMAGKAWRFEMWAYMEGGGRFANLRDAVTGYGVSIGRSVPTFNAYTYEAQSPAIGSGGALGSAEQRPPENAWIHIAIEQKPGDLIRLYDSYNGGYVASLGSSTDHVFGVAPSMGRFQMFPRPADGASFVSVNVDSVLFRWFEEEEEDLLYLNGYVEPDGPFEPPPYAYTLVDPDDDTIRNVVETLCRRTGIPEVKFDASALDSITRPVRALSYAQVTPIRGVLDQLASAYFFEMYVTDKLYFVPRGGSVVLTVDADDMGAGEDAHAEEPLTVNITADSEIPAQIALTYANVDSDHNKASEHSDRLLSGVVSTAAMDMPVACTSAEAKGVADAALLDTYSSRIAGNVSLPMGYTQLVPTDVVVLPGPDGTQYRSRLVRRRDAGSVIDFEWVNDDPTALISAGITSDDYTPGVTVTLSSLTTLILLDIPLLRDADNSPGIYSAMKPVGTTWPGAQLLSSVDGVEYEPEGTVSSRGTFGTTTTALTSYTGPNMFDMVGTVTVNVGAGTMSSATRDDLLDLDANAVLIGNEIIQYTTATIQSAGIYALTGLLRGRRGTDWAMTGHAIGERAVVLNTAGMLRVSHEAARIGLEVSYKGVTLGKLLSTATAQTNTDTGVSLKPLSPQNVRRGATLLTWDRRTRLSYRWPNTVAPPLGEESESWEVDWLDEASAVVSTTATTSAQATIPTGVYGANVYQMSSIVGRGYAGSIEWEPVPEGVTVEQQSALPVTDGNRAVVYFWGWSEVMYSASPPNSRYIGGWTGPIGAGYSPTGTVKMVLTQYDESITPTANDVPLGTAGDLVHPYRHVQAEELAAWITTYNTPLPDEEKLYFYDPLGDDGAGTNSESILPGDQSDFVHALTRFGTYVTRPLGYSSDYLHPAPFALILPRGYRGLEGDRQGSSGDAPKALSWAIDVVFNDGTDYPAGGYSYEFETPGAFDSDPGSEEPEYIAPNAVAIPQIVAVGFTLDVVEDATYIVTLGGVEFSYVALAGDTHTDISTELATLIDADADYSATTDGTSIIVTGAAGVSFLHGASVVLP